MRFNSTQLNSAIQFNSIQFSSVPFNPIPSDATQPTPPDRSPTMRHPANHIFELDPGRLRECVVARHMQRFRAEQIRTWVYQRLVGDPAEMTNLSKRDREQLGEWLRIASGRIVREEVASDHTHKLLIQWDEPDDGHAATGSTQPTVTTWSHDDSAGALPVVNGASSAGAPSAGAKALETECVMIPAGENEDRRPRRTACISSQVGCPVGCRFCASGLGGLDGNLSAGRIVEQVWHLNRMLARHAPDPEKPERITNVVFMGMGEPLANYNAVINAARVLNADWAFNISARKITISTVGLPHAIRRLAREQLPVTLALSLHAPNDSIRRELIPWAEYATIDELMSACRMYFQETGREITFEYTLLRDVNDRPEHAAQLARIVKSVRGNVNLIRYNEVADLPYERPRGDDVHEFQGILRSKDVNAHIRASRGRDIAAACGQLRHESAKGYAT